MIKKLGIYLLVLLLIGCMAAWYFTTRSNVDHKYVDQLDKFDLASNQINGRKLFLEFKNDEKLYALNRVYLRQEDLPKDTLPHLQYLFNESLIETLIVGKQGELIFKLKACHSSDCGYRTHGFTGPYYHFLSKHAGGRFQYYPNKKVSKLIEKKQIGNWTYYIEWQRKG